MTVKSCIVILACSACLHAEAPVDKAWSILSAAAQDKSYEKRGKAIQALGLVRGDTRAQSTAETALKDEKEDVRATAADVLGVMGAKGSIPKLKEAAKDSAASVVFAAANALFVLGDPAAYQVYYAVLTGQRKSGDALVDSQMKMLKDPKAMTKLGLEAGIGFIPFGGVSYKVLKLATDDTTSPVRAAAAVKLSLDPDPKSAQALGEMSKDSKWLVRAAVAGAMARRNDASMVKFVTPLLDDENEVVRFSAAAAVIHLSSRAGSQPAPPAKKK